MFKTSILTILALLIFLSPSSAEENDNDQRFSIYMHPVSLLASAYASIVFQEPNFYLEFTGEFPLGKYASLVIVPSVSRLGFDIIDDEDLFKAGSGVGIRLFPNGESKGFYLQLMPSVYYIKEKSSYDWGRVTKNQSGIYADALGYIGYSFKFSKFSAFLDAGLGARYSRLSGTCSDNFDDKISKIKTREIGLFADINLGIGIPL